MIGSFLCLWKPFNVRKDSSFIFCKSDRKTNACLVTISCSIFWNCLTELTHFFPAITPLSNKYQQYFMKLYEFSLEELYDWLMVLTDQQLIKWSFQIAYWQTTLYSRHNSQIYPCSKWCSLALNSDLIHFRVWEKDCYQTDTFRRSFLVQLDVID